MPETPNTPLSSIPKEAGGGPVHEGHRRRLRERFAKTRLNGFQEYEILELLLSFAIPRRDVKPFAREAILRFGSLADLLDAGGAELLELPGFGPNSVVLVKLVRELVDRYLEAPLRRCNLLKNRDAVLRFMRTKLGGSHKEALLIFFLGSRNRLIDWRVYSGTVDRSALFLREIAEHAVFCRATGVIAAHNHPSGICEASEDDREFTRRLRQAFDPLGVVLHDHFIATRGTAISLLDGKK